MRAALATVTLAFAAAALLPRSADAQACGGGPPCSPGQRCVGGACVCDAASCPTFCCNGNVCTPPSLNACGSNGSACVQCNVVYADSCTAGGCSCGGGPSCSPGQRCVGGTCVCDAASCPIFCCDGNVCTPPSLNSCGTSGAACAPCDLETADTCTAGGCRCGSGPACAAGLVCQSGACAASTEIPAAGPGAITALGATLVAVAWSALSRRARRARGARSQAR